MLKRAARAAILSSNDTAFVVFASAATVAPAAASFFSDSAFRAAAAAAAAVEAAAAAAVEAKAAAKAKANAAVAITTSGAAAAAASHSRVLSREAADSELLMKIIVHSWDILVQYSQRDSIDCMKSVELANEVRQRVGSEGFQMVKRYYPGFLHLLEDFLHIFEVRDVTSDKA